MVPLQIMPALEKQCFIYMDKPNGWARQQTGSGLNGLCVKISAVKKGNDFIENEGCGNQIRGFAGAEVSPVGDGLRMVLVVLRFNGYDIAGVKK
jgi:hypothetical protein